jgi:hypothetical protein
MAGFGTVVSEGSYMSRSISLNILRVSLILVLLGFFLPVACDLNGRQIGQAILGESHQAVNARILGVIANFYGYFLFAAFGCAAAGLLLTFIPRIRFGYYGGLLFMAASFVFFVLVLLEFLAIREGAVLGFLITTFNLRVTVLIGGYSMAAGYLAAVISLVVKIIRKR